MNEKPKVIIYRENFIQSVFADIVSVGLVVVSFAFNHIFVGSGFLNGVLLVMLVLFLVAKAGNKRRTFTNVDDAVAYLRSERSDP